MRINHSAFGLDVDIILTGTALHLLPLPPVGAINWVVCCRHLGVFFTTGCTFKCNFDHIKSCFFRACNALYSNFGRLASEEVVLSLIRTKWPPILLYATEACPLLSRNRISFEFHVLRQLSAFTSVVTGIRCAETQCSLPCLLGFY